MKRGGTADLPLHGGRVPRWLANRMTRIGVAIVEAIVAEHGKSELLTRLSDPFWFQALGCVMGMDWHSSGITTSVMGALKRGINPISHDLGIHVCGGRGKHSLKTPAELEALASRIGLDGNSLIRSSKLSAKVDNAGVQDGYSLYLHNFVVTDNGEWAVVQQGMNKVTKMARRYHWHSRSVRSFVLDPQTAIVGRNHGRIINLSDGRAKDAQDGILEFLREHPDRQLKEMRRLTMPSHHDVKPMNVNSKRLGAVLALAYESQFKEFADALLLKGVGPRTLQALALVSEVIFGAPSRFDDPARFSFAHGGKDGAPFPVPTRVYDESIAILGRAVEKARMNHTDRLRGLEKLTRFARHIERRHAPDSNVNAVIQKERAESHLYGGRTVKGPSRPPRPAPSKPVQLGLFE
ncbi:MAG: DUF763 domain-containing protein [Desulfobacterales bacterium]|nr:DUF763 domain-containing protein [Desulfobacterales bacterium]